eukprot:m.244279 g.244279  ORF g.244279 m.244279 type:complete len:157 (+) comp14422_c0_seq1:2-472(+)
MGGHPGLAAMGGAGGAVNLSAMLQQMGVNPAQAAAVGNLAAARGGFAAPPNTFKQIHVYLLEKVRGDKGRIDDFHALLAALKGNCCSATVTQHLRTHPDFHHRNVFKGNRYHDLRLQLSGVAPDILQTMLDDYLEFLAGVPASAADGELRGRLLPL